MTRKEQIIKLVDDYKASDPVANKLLNRNAAFGLVRHVLEWADKNPDISMVSALAYDAGREAAINDAAEWLKGNLHLAIDCDDEGRCHIDPNFVDYFKVRLRMRLEKGGEQ